MNTLTILDVLHEALETDTTQQINTLLEELHPSEIAHLLESLPTKQRQDLWQKINWEEIDIEQGEILPYLADTIRNELMQTMHPSEVAAATQEMDTDDAVDVLQELPEELIEEVLQAMDAQHRQRLTQVLFYPEDSAGGLMNTDTLTIRADVTLDVVLRYLRLYDELPEKTDALIVVDRENYYVGILPFTKLLVYNPEVTVGQIMHESFEAVLASLSTHDVARLFEQRDLISVPVVDEKGKLVGRITVDDVVDVIRAEADHNLMGRAGLDEDDDMFASVLTTTHARSLWLGINLATAFLAAAVIGLFENTLEHIVALAVLMPIVASMGGIAGSQTLTIMIRAMALGKISETNAPWLLKKELAVGSLNGLIWGIFVTVMAILWFNDVKLGMVIGVAIIINLFFAALSGALLPLLLKRFSIDPALAGGVILTTVTDVIGFASFLGLATLFLLQ